MYKIIPLNVFVRYNIVSIFHLGINVRKFATTVTILRKHRREEMRPHFHEDSQFIGHRHESLKR